MTEQSMEQNKILIIDKTIVRLGLAFALKSGGFSTIEFDPSDLNINPLPKYETPVSLGIVGECAKLPDTCAIIRELEIRGIPGVVIIDPSDQQKAAEYLTTMYRLGVRGYLDIRCSPTDVSEHVGRFIKGEYFMPQSLQDTLIHSVNHLYDTNSRTKLSEIEEEITNMLWLPNKEIAARLQVEERTVKRLINHMLSTLNVKSKRQAAILLEERRLSH